MINRLKKNNKKGFTLVELIVVMVILAILAALLIPALVGYIDKAKEKQIIAETRQVAMAAQTLADEAYGTFDLGATTTISFSKTETTNLKSGKIKFDDVAALAEVTVGYIEKIEVSSTDKALITTVEYKRDGKTCTYTKSNTSTPGTFIVEKDNAQSGGGSGS